MEVVPFEDVTADCAAAEGGGTLAAWKKAHRKAFTAACEEIGRNFDESMKCSASILMWFTAQLDSEINLANVFLKSFFRFSDFLLEKGRIKLNPQQLWIFEKDI